VNSATETQSNINAKSLLTWVSMRSIKPTSRQRVRHHVRLYLAPLDDRRVQVCARSEGPVGELSIEVSQRIQDQWRQGREVGIGGAAEGRVALCVLPILQVDQQWPADPELRRPRVVTLSARRWAVPSTSTDGWRFVAQPPDEKHFVCSCPANRVGFSEGRQCRHIDLVDRLLRSTM